MVHEERRQIYGRIVEIKGSGHHIYIDGDDVTDEIISEMADTRESHGIRLPRGNDEVFTTVKMLLRAGRLGGDQE